MSDAPEPFDTVEICYGNGGWVRVTSESLPLPGPLYLRLQPDQWGRWRTTELFLDFRSEQITGRLLRELPLGWLESAILAEGGDVPSWRSKVNEPSMDLSRAAENFADGDAICRTPDRDTTLDPPPYGRLTDEWLQHLARAYNAAVNRREKPNVSLSAQAGVSLRTVQQWTYQARKRGFLPPGQPGRAG